MVRVRRANSIIEIKDDALDRYLDMGYVQIDEKGNVLKRGIPTSIGELQVAYTNHMKQIEDLNNEIKKLKAENKKLKAANKE
jgi:hypothetical protein